MQDLSDRYTVWLCDVWGVVHNGVASFPKALDALRRHRGNSGMVILLTNAPRPRQAIERQLAGLGVGGDCYDIVVTSGDVARDLVGRHAGAKVFHLGPERNLPLLDGLGVGIGGIEETEAVVCTGLFDDTTETPDDYAGLLKEMRERQLEMVCANPDKQVRRGDDLIYCAGAIAERFEAMGGKVLMAGKPFAPMYELASEEAARIFGHAPEKSRMLAIGDGPETDIAGAAAFGLDAILIAGGISHGHAPEELTKAVQALVPNARIIRTLADLEWR